MNGLRVNVLLRTVDAYHRRLESLFLFPARHCVDRHGQYFSLLRKDLVYSAGNDPNPADICPTGRGALTQVCHFISTVKSIKSPHWGSLLSCLYSICLVFFCLFFLFGWAVSRIFFQELKFTQVLKCILKSLEEVIKKKKSWIRICSLCLSCFTNLQYSTVETLKKHGTQLCMD